MSYKFWMVYNPDGSKPTVSHATEELAATEAQRLAAANPGKRFMVLESMCEYGTAKPQIEKTSHVHAPQVASA